MEAPFSVTAAWALNAEAVIEEGAEKLAPVASSDAPEQPASPSASNAAHSADTYKGAVCLTRMLTADEYRREAQKMQVKAWVCGLLQAVKDKSGQKGRN